ncbi:MULTISPECIES: hypothetical protein [unclassified Microbacterium]|uniref:hypothetical protein n=1 Tax=unclassified Microbacterium TaxID=2609290 RepID=UPI0038671CA8
MTEHDADQNATDDGEAPIEQQNPLGGDDTTEEELDADNDVEADTVAMLDPDDTPA